MGQSEPRTTVAPESHRSRQRQARDARSSPRRRDQCVNTAYTGPVADALGDVDLALPAGMLVASAVYVLMARRTRDGLGGMPRA